MEAQLLIPLREGTKAFIAQDPTTIVVSRSPSQPVRGPGGGLVPAPAVPATTHQVKLIGSDGSKVRSGEGGSTHAADYTVVAEYDAELKVGDIWTDANANSWRISEQLPYDGYQKKFLAVSSGKNLSDG